MRFLCFFSPLLSRAPTCWLKRRLLPTERTSFEPFHLSAKPNVGEKDIDCFSVLFFFFFSCYSQVTAYGGELRYTVQYSSSPRSLVIDGQPDVVIQGNGIFLEHYSGTKPQPRVPHTVTVVFREVGWLYTYTFKTNVRPTSLYET